MNAKPGDIAMIVWHNDTYPIFGRILEVMYASPGGFFYLPDGVPHNDMQEHGHGWVCRVSEGTIKATFKGGWRDAKYVVCPDAALRRIGDTQDLPELEHRWRHVI